MEIYILDKKFEKYLSDKVDGEVYCSHKTETDRGRLYLAIEAEYRGRQQLFAVPFTGHYNPNKYKNAVEISIDTESDNFRSAFIFEKMIVVEDSDMFFADSKDNMCLRVSNAITPRVVDDLYNKIDIYLKIKTQNKPTRFSTDIDKHIEFLNNRAMLRKTGLQDNEIYEMSYSKLKEIAKVYSEKSENFTIKDVAATVDDEQVNNTGQDGFNVSDEFGEIDWENEQQNLETLEQDEKRQQSGQIDTSDEAMLERLRAYKDGKYETLLEKKEKSWTDVIRITNGLYYFCNQNTEQVLRILEKSCDLTQHQIERAPQGLERVKTLQASLTNKEQTQSKDKKPMPKQRPSRGALVDE